MMKIMNRNESNDRKEGPIYFSVLYKANGSWLNKQISGVDIDDETASRLMYLRYDAASVNNYNRFYGAGNNIALTLNSKLLEPCSRTLMRIINVDRYPQWAEADSRTEYIDLAIIGFFAIVLSHVDSNDGLQLLQALETGRVASMEEILEMPEISPYAERIRDTFVQLFKDGFPVSHVVKSEQSENRSWKRILSKIAEFFSAGGEFLASRHQIVVHDENTNRYLIKTGDLEFPLLGVILSSTPDLTQTLIQSSIKRAQSLADVSSENVQKWKKDEDARNKLMSRISELTAGQYTEKFNHDKLSANYAMLPDPDQIVAQMLLLSGALDDNNEGSWTAKFDEAINDMKDEDFDIVDESESVIQSESSPSIYRLWLESLVDQD